MCSPTYLVFVQCYHVSHTDVQRDLFNFVCFYHYETPHQFLRTTYTVHVDVIKLSVMLLDSFYHNVISAMALPVLSYARSVYLIQASTQLEGKMAQPES